MKGLSLSINLVVIMIVVVIILVVLSTFFMSSLAPQISRLEAEQIFTEGCSNLCKDPCESWFHIGVGINNHETNDFHTKFREACVVLGFTQPVDSAVSELLRFQSEQCLESCGSCEVTGCGPGTYSTE
ncbi:hypothetical protein ACFLQN_02505 [Candidatus Aenigmatarchaeota archaeon]